MRRAIDEQHAVGSGPSGRFCSMPPVSSTARTPSSPNGRGALVIETSGRADGRRAEREHDGRRPGREKLLELRVERVGAVVEHAARASRRSAANRVAASASTREYSASVPSGENWPSNIGWPAGRQTELGAQPCHGLASIRASCRARAPSAVPASQRAELAARAVQRAAACGITGGVRRARRTASARARSTPTAVVRARRRPASRT